MSAQPDIAPTAPPVPTSPLVDTWAIIPLDDIAESSTNPRREFAAADMKELTDSIRDHGVLCPILVRPMVKTGAESKGYEIVFGHRRFRAARAAELTHIPAMIRELSDVEVLEMQLVENLQRSDLHPLEEADGYRELHDRHRIHVDDIAAKVGKSKAYVYSRLKLCELGKEARKAFLAGKVNPSVALMLARIPDEKLQAKAAGEVSSNHMGEPMSSREASSFIQRSYMLRLADAPWSLTDAELVPAAGACMTCPKRTGTQKDLFPDVGKVDMCTDPKCFKGKMDAHWHRRVGEVEESGGAVLSESQAKKVFPYGGSQAAETSGLVDLDATNYQDPKNRTWKQILGKKITGASGADIPITLARDERGGIHELVPAEAVREVLGLKKPKGKDSVPGSNVGDSMQRERQAKDRERNEVTRVAIERVLEKAFRETNNWGPETWEIIVSSMLSREACVAVAKRRELEVGKKSDPYLAVKEQLVKGATAADLKQLLFELAITRNAYGNWMSGVSEHVTAACKLFGVDLAKVKAEVAKARKDAAKGKKPKPAPKKNTASKVAVKENGGPLPGPKKKARRPSGKKKNARRGGRHKASKASS